jgi:hypothetical protein
VTLGRLGCKHNKFHSKTAEVREWLAGSLAHLFSNARGLGGIFCITASENLTNCYSHGHAELCPRCAQRDGSQVIAEVIQTLREGVRRSSAQADVIAWDWGWGENWIRNGADPARVIQRLPEDVALLSVSEWDKPIDRGGHRTTVGEYSISVVGPGERALGNWGMARDRGLPTFAKVQWGCTWEISAVPYVPVPNLILEHCDNLRKTGIKGLQASWTVGGYPSPNFEVAKECYFSPVPELSRVLSEVAALWESGLEEFHRALRRVPASKQPSARKDLGIAETCYLHFKSVANQILFCRLRAAYQEAPPHARPALADHMVKVAREEIEFAKRQYAIAREDSTIAFEASNHYYYRPLDLVEKVLNCHYIISALNTGLGS